MKKTRLVPIWKSYLAVIVTGIIFVLIARSTFYMFLDMRETRLLARSLEESFEATVKREKKLVEEIAHLYTEKGIQEEILSKFNVAQTGENVVIIVDPKEVYQATSSEISNIPENSFWDKLKFEE